eukprot:8526985-Karenia_brevis.AAC.1
MHKESEDAASVLMITLYNFEHVQGTHRKNIIARGLRMRKWQAGIERGLEIGKVGEARASIMPLYRQMLTSSIERLSSI